MVGLIEIGSNDGTPNGTFEKARIGGQEYNSKVDVFGNAFSFNKYAKQSGFISASPLNKSTLDSQIEAVEPYGPSLTIVSPTGYKSGLIAGMDANGQIIDIDFSRATTATYVDRNGIIREAASNVPRFDYSGGASCPSLLLEPSRTNLATQSEDIDAVFTKQTGITFESNSTLSPEGVINASKVNNPSASPLGAYYVSMSFTDNDTMVASIFAKAGTNSTLRFGVTNQDEGRHIYYNFNLDEGTFSFLAETGGMTNYSADIEDYGNGWYRCIVIGTFPSSGVYKRRSNSQDFL